MNNAYGGGFGVIASKGDRNAIHRKTGDVHTMTSPAKTMGAPSALKAIEEHELLCRNEKDIARIARDEALLKLVVGDDMSEKNYRHKVTLYSDALANWDEALKRLNLFDKSVKESRREGEKIPVAEAQEIVRQMELTLRLGVESFFLAFCGTSARLESPQEIHFEGKSILETSIQIAKDEAKRENALPEWVE